MRYLSGCMREEIQSVRRCVNSCKRISSSAATTELEHVGQTTGPRLLLLRLGSWRLRAGARLSCGISASARLGHEARERRTTLIRTLLRLRRLTVCCRALVLVLVLIVAETGLDGQITAMRSIRRFDADRRRTDPVCRLRCVIVSDISASSKIPGHDPYS